MPILLNGSGHGSLGRHSNVRSTSGVRSWPMLIGLSLVTPMLLSLGTWYLLGVQVPGFIDEIAIEIDAILASFSGEAE